MNTLTRGAVLTILATVFVTPLAADIRIRVSVKVILNPDDGSLPTYQVMGQERTFDPVRVRDRLDSANLNEMGPFGRGYSFELQEPVVEIGGEGQHDSGPSQYFNTDFGDAAPDELRQEFLTTAMEDPEYAWNPLAMNIYVNQSTNLQTFGEVIVLNAGASNTDRMPYVHEGAHFFTVCHTQGCCGCCDRCLVLSDDGVSDTLWDRSCWDQDDISSFNFLGRTYNQLNAAEREQVDNVFFNIMSYHNHDPPCGQNSQRVRLTEGQLDRWSNAANNARRNVVSGDTIVADPGAGFFGDGSFAFPYDTVGEAHTNATNNGSDIVLLRNGTYSRDTFPLFLNRNMTFRAPRGARALMGIP